MSPEQAADPSAAGPGSDIYGIGALLYRSLTGKPPVARADEELDHFLARIRSETPVWPSDHVPGLNTWLGSCLALISMNCLRKDVSERFASADRLAAALDDWLVQAEQKRAAPEVATRFRRAFRNALGEPDRDYDLVIEHEIASFLMMGYGFLLTLWSGFLLVHEKIGLLELALFAVQMNVIATLWVTIPKWQAGAQRDELRGEPADPGVLPPHPEGGGASRTSFAGRSQ